MAETNKSGIKLPKQFWMIILANSRWDAGGGGNSAQQYARAMSKRNIPYLFVKPSDAGKACWFIRNGGVSFARPTVFCSLPTPNYFEICRYLKKQGCRIIYRIVDRWDSMPYNYWYDIRRERSLIELADICYASSTALARRFAKIRADIKILLNAVDIDRFCKRPLRRPADLKLGVITIGFWGSFWQEWFDWLLIKTAAAKRPNWYFNLIGGDPQRIG